ncbi:MAG: TrmH family RNA methyltransferase [Actinomycetota bacterium]
MITSLHNAQVVKARKLKKRGVRERTRHFLIEGTIGIREALARQARLGALFVESDSGETGAAEGLLESARAAAIPCFEVSPQVMRVISDAATPPGAVAIGLFIHSEVSRLLDDPGTLVVVVDRVRDPGNLGTILRTAWAAGVESLFLGEGTVDVYNPKVVRAAAGAFFHLRFAREVAIPSILQELGNRGIHRVGAAPGAGVAYDQLDLSRACALVFGNEIRGLENEAAASVDEMAFIPMAASADSLNVGVAAAVFLFEVQRQRRQEKGHGSRHDA